MGQTTSATDSTTKPASVPGGLRPVSAPFLQPRPRLPPPRILAIAAVVALGSVALLPVWASAWRLWSIDPLRSIGALFPALALLGTLAAWRSLGWTTRGSRWGLALLLAGIAAASLFSAPNLLVFLFGQRVRILHPGMALFAYGAGCALWFGGAPLLRRALAPLCLLLLIDPVPHLVNTLLDFPMQVFSANTARAFAHLIGLQPTGEQLQMMFTPSFGMFIVPGCNGVRGAITFGYLALIFGYLRHLPARTLTLFTFVAVLAGYLFNLLRLCILVLYYRTGVSFPSIRHLGTQVDYAIGITLFLIATIGTGFLITLYAHRRGLDVQDDAAHVRSASALPGSAAISNRRPVLRRVVFLGVLALAFFLPQARSVAASFRAPLTAQDALNAFPQTVGTWTLTDTWEERDNSGALMFVFGDYAQAPAGQQDIPQPVAATEPSATFAPPLAHLTFGIYLASEDHYVFLSKLKQGVKPVSHGAFDAHTANGVPVHLLTSFYRDPDLLTLDAEANCRDSSCEGNFASAADVGLLRPHLADLLVAPMTRSVPVLLRRTWPRSGPGSLSVPDATLRAGFEAAAQDFLAHLNLKPLLDKSSQ